MNDDAFEKKIRGVPIKPIPAGWRDDILRTARAARQPAPGAQERFAPVAGLLCWKNWLWPRPAAWAGLGAIWILFLGVALTTSRSGETTGNNSAVTQSQNAATLPEQRELLSQLLDSAPPPAAPAGSLAPRRRSQLQLDQVAA
jgi:hypothetical protein